MMNIKWSAKKIKMYSPPKICFIVLLFQPIRSKFTFFADYSPGCDEPRKKDTADWWKTFETLQSVLRQAADAAHKNNKFSAERRHQYYLSGM